MSKRIIRTVLDKIKIKRKTIVLILCLAYTINNTYIIYYITLYKNSY